MRKRLVAAVMSTMSAVLSVEALAQANPNQLIANRKGAMNLQGKYFSPVLGMSLGRAP